MTVAADRVTDAAVATGAPAVSATRWKRYPAYKDSGVEWLGEVPAHWDIRELKYISSSKSSNVDKHKTEGEDTVRLCNYTDVYYNEYITADLGFMEATASKEEIERFTLRAGDVIVTKDSESWEDIAVPAYVPADLERVLCGYHLALIRPDTEVIDGRYLLRSFEARGLNEQFKVAATGITRYGLGKYWLDNSRFLVPPLDEQRAIAGFLDRETERIDTLIAKKERLIELLQEKRTALISHAVTKGLDPDAPMKDSGLYWLGDIPAHWEIRKTKYLFRLVTDQAPDNHNMKLLSVYTDIGVEPRSALEPKGNKASTTDGYWIVRKGDIVVNKLLTWMGAIGHSKYDGVTSPAYDVLRQTVALASKYYGYLFRSGLYLTEFRRRSHGIMDMRLRLYFDEFAQIPLPYPPLHEQKAVVAHLDKVCGEIDTLVNKVDEHITRLREYRTALISAAVTGKIDVRQEV